MNESIVRPRPLLDDMRLFARVAEAGSLSAAARTLGLPKQTVSRRLAELEDALGVQLAHRTTRRLRLTEAGTAYAERCAELSRLAEDANRAVTDSSATPRGTLRVTADPTFGEAFLSDLVAEYLGRHAEVRVEIVLTSRHVDLVEEGFDVAFRIGRPADSSLIGTRLGGAKLLYCAAPAYLAVAGAPQHPEDLRAHECIELAPSPGPIRWPFSLRPGEMTLLPVTGRLQVSSLQLALTAARDGLGIANLPAFACAEDLASGRLRTVLDPFVADLGGVWLVTPPHRWLAARVRRFVDLAVQRFRGRDV
jgi:DNA-binding transcriptional LysR family regulator